MEWIEKDGVLHPSLISGFELNDFSFSYLKKTFTNLASSSESIGDLKELIRSMYKNIK